VYASRDSRENVASSPIIALLRHAKTEETVLRTSSDMSVIVFRDSPDHIVRLHLTRATQILANMEHAFCRGHLINAFVSQVFPVLLAINPTVLR
jgi:hypothetical protein